MSYPAIFYDGKTATAREAALEVASATVRIRFLDGTRAVNWPKKRIVRVPGMPADGPLRLKLKGSDPARLVVTDAAAQAGLLSQLPGLLHRHRARHFVQTAGILALTTIVLVAALYVAIPRLAKPIASRIPPEFEAQIGRSTLNSLVSRFAQCTGDGTEALHVLQQKIGAVEPRSLGIEIVVVNAPMVNAFALPGGKVVLTSGILDFMEDGDELAGVLAHEIGHVALGHPMEGLLSQVGLQLLLNLVSGGGSGDVVGIGVMMASTSYSREYEREADRLALKILTDARIEPRAYGDLFDRFAAKDGEQSGAGTVGLGNLLRTHPYSDERADQARGVQVPDPQPALTDEAWMAIKSLCGTEDRNR